MTDPTMANLVTRFHAIGLELRLELGGECTIRNPADGHTAVTIGRRLNGFVNIIYPPTAATLATVCGIARRITRRQRVRDTQHEVLLLVIQGLEHIDNEIRSGTIAQRIYPPGQKGTNHGNPK